VRLSPYGAREWIGLSVLLLGATAALVIFFPYATPVPIIALCFVVQFFRDPERTPLEPDRTVISPADGVLTDISSYEEQEYLRCGARRYGIFMNVFSVHVNRAPVGGVVEFVRHTSGKFLDARDPRAFSDNERVTIGIVADDPRCGRICVKMIAGLVARRIVCGVKEGDRVAKGQRIGMIKFGSRVEVYIPEGFGDEPAVGLGEGVRAGADTLARVK